jgi:hypothetical protein
MPLLDHFHAPILLGHSWESFHAFWAVALCRALNRILPPRFLAEAVVHTGPVVVVALANLDYPGG